MLCYAIRCYAILYYAMQCYAILCCAMRCYAMLCYAMLCYAIRCHAMLYYAMLGYAMQSKIVPKSIPKRSKIGPESIQNLSRIGPRSASAPTSLPTSILDRLASVFRTVWDGFWQPLGGFSGVTVGSSRTKNRFLEVVDGIQKHT